MRSHAGIKAAAGFRDELLLPLVKGVGVYNGNDLTAAAAFDTWLGHPADLQNVFFDSSSWTAFANGIGYETNLFTGRNCIWSVPLAAQQGTLPAVVAGTYDATFLACAKAILANAPANKAIIVRLGWEFNLLSSPSRAFDGSGNPTPTTWVSAYQHVVNIFRTTSQRFRFVWCPNIDDASSNGLTITDCYPGDAYVDYVAIDAYFDDAYDGVTDLGAGVFGYFKGQGSGLDWLVSFAAAHSKAWCMPEWGVNDNAATTYFDDFCSYLVANNCAFTGYWNSNSAFTGKLSDDQFPALSTIYKKYFGTPVITSTDISVIQNTPGSVSLTSSQDGVYTITWSIVGGADAASFSISGSTLSWGSIAASTKVVTVRATDSLGYHTDKTLNITFAAPYVFTNTEASALVARMSVAPTEGRKAIIDTYVGAIKSAGVWTLLDTLYVLAAPDATDALLNWVQNLNNASIVNTPSFVADRGYTGSYGTQSYVTTNRAGNASGHYTTNSASFGVWELTNLASNSGSFAGAGDAGLNGRTSSNQAQAAVNDYSSALSAASTDSRGFWVGNRSGSTARQFYWNGSSIASDTAASSTITSAAFIICAENSSYPEARQIGIAFTGGSLTSTQIGNFYTATYNYMHAIGAV